MHIAESRRSPASTHIIRIPHDSEYSQFVNPRCSYCTRRYAMKKTGRRRREGVRFLEFSDDEYRCEYCGHIEWL